MTHRTHRVPTAATLLFIVGVLHTTHAAAGIYKCTVSGKTVFQDRPCANASSDQNLVDVKPVAPSSAAPATNAETEALNKYFDAARIEDRQRELQYKISNKQREKSSLQSQMDRELAALREKKLYANNNLAGATYQQSISSEMQAVATSYDTKIRSIDAEIERYQKELETLK